MTDPKYEFEIQIPQWLFDGRARLQSTGSVTRSLFKDHLKTDLGIVVDNFYMKSSADFHDSF